MTHGRPDFSPTAADVVLRSEWGAHEGFDKRIGGQGTGLLDDVDVSTAYVVPAGKELRVYLAECAIWGGAGALRQAWQYAQFTVSVVLGVTLRVGVDGGGVMPLAEPLVVPGGSTFVMKITNRANHECAWSMDAYATEVTL